MAHRATNIAMFFLMTLFLISCSNKDAADIDGDTADGDGVTADGDVVTDGDEVSDGDSIADGDLDGDKESSVDGDEDVDLDGEIDGDADSDADMESDEEAEDDSDIDGDLDVDIDVDIDMEMDGDTDSETEKEDSENPCNPNPCTDSAGHRTRCMQDGQGGYDCLCDSSYHDSDGICCHAYSNNTGGECKCVENYIDPDDSGNCEVICTDQLVEGFNGYCEDGKICVQGECKTDYCIGVICTANSKCVVHSDSYSCDCNDGYHKSDGLCCHANASNISGGCQCDEGYTDNNGICEPDDGNKCEPNPCSSNTGNLNKCVTDLTVDGYHCECNEGFELDGDECEIIKVATCPGALQCEHSYCVPTDQSDEQCLVDDDCKEFNPSAPTTCNASAAGGICLGCSAHSDCPGNSQCNNYATCANICDDDNDCPYGKCYSGVGYCGVRRCYTSDDCFNGTVCLVESGTSQGMCKRIPCQMTK